MLTRTPARLLFVRYARLARLACFVLGAIAPAALAAPATATAAAAAAPTSVEKAPAVIVVLDLVPGDPSPHVVLATPGSLTAAILGTDAYDVAAIDATRLFLGAARANKERVSYTDVDGDGRLDLVFRVGKSQLGLPEDATSVTLRGSFRDGRPLAASAPIRIDTAPAPDPVLEKQPRLHARIDVQPGDASTLVDRGAPGDLRVAIYGSDGLDAGKVDPSTIDLAGAPVSRDDVDDPAASLEDVDGDGRLDLVVSFPRRLLRVAPGPATVTLSGALADGRGFSGSDTIVVQGAHAAPPLLTPSSSATFSNPAPIAIPAGAPGASSGPASPYPSSITVSGLTGFVQSVTVTLTGLTHTHPDDLDVLLVGPDGQSLVLMSDVGGSTGASNLTLTLTDAAPATLPDEGALATGSYRPTNVGAGDPFPAPAPAPSSATAFTVFRGSEANGAWRLFIVDDNAADVGSLAGGWSVTITTAVTTVCNSGSILLPETGSSGIGGPYPSTISVSGVLGIVTSATVSLRLFNHSYPDDVDLLVTGPGGGSAVVMSDAGGSTGTNGPVTINLDDAAAIPVPDETPLQSGKFRPANYDTLVDPFPAPAPAITGSSNLSVFNGTDPNTDWKLYAVDDAPGDTGIIQSGWCLTLTTTSCAGGPPCNDGNPCTDDVCDPATGRCSFVPDDTNPCDDGNPCTRNDSCESGECVEGGPSGCESDGNPCTDESCDPVAGCISTPNTEPCDDGNACTTGDRCGGGTCQPGAPASCDDGNPCTDDTCTPASGCAHAANTAPCNDGNACTTGDACADGACHGGAPSSCDDGNVCTDDACDPGAGCVFTSNNSCNTKGAGYWKQLCRGPHSGDAYTSYDVDCVNDSCTFAQVASIADLCDRLVPDPPNDKCEQAEADFMGLLLNLCRHRVAPGQSIDSRCGPHQSVDASRAAADAALCDPARDAGSCLHAECAASEITSGAALGSNTLRVRIEGDGIRLNWELPYISPETLAPPGRYRIFRRTCAGDPGVQIGEVNGSNLTFLDPGAAAGAAGYAYEVVTVW